MTEKNTNKKIPEIFNFSTRLLGLKNQLANLSSLESHEVMQQNNKKSINKLKNVSIQILLQYFMQRKTFNRKAELSSFTEFYY